MRLATDLRFIKFIWFYPPASGVRCTAEVLGGVSGTGLVREDADSQKGEIAGFKGVVYKNETK
jgi:hypothetical protein